MKEEISEIIAKEAVGLPLRRLDRKKQMDCEYAADRIMDYLYDKGLYNGSNNL